MFRKSIYQNIKTIKQTFKPVLQARRNKEQLYVLNKVQAFLYLYKASQIFLYSYKASQQLP